MATGSYSPYPAFTLFDNSGNIVSGGKIFTYLAGTSTKTPTYTNVSLSSSNTNPIVTDSAGRATIFLDPALSYKFIAATSTAADPPAGADIYWTRDNITPVPIAGEAIEFSGIAGEDITGGGAGSAVFLSNGDGGLTAGRWYHTDSDFDYRSTKAICLGWPLGNITSGSSGLIRVSGRVTGLSGLTEGLIYFLGPVPGSLQNPGPVNARAFAVADTANSYILLQAIPPLGSTLAFTPGQATATAASSIVNGVLDVNLTAVGNVGGGTDDLMTYSLPANVLFTNETCIHVVASFTVANNANAKTLTFVWNSANILAATLIASVATPAHAEFWIYRTGGSAQRIFGYISQGGGTGAAQTQFNANTTGAGVETGAIPLKFTAAATADNDVQQQSMMIETLGIASAR